MKEAIHERTNIIWFHLYDLSRIGKSIETESRLVVPGPGRRGEWGVSAKGYRVSSGVVKAFWN